MIRASVQVQFLVPTVQTDDLRRDENVILTYNVPMAEASYFYIIYGIEEDFQGRHPVAFDDAIAPDVYAYLLEKAVSDELAYAEDSFIHFFQKGREQPQEFTEVRTVAIQKSIHDHLVATDDFLGEANIDDDQVAWVVKPRYDRVRPTDDDTIDFSKNVVDPAVTSEEVTRGMVRQYEDEYASEDIKTFSLEKPFADSVDYPTDSAVSHVEKNRSEELAFTGDATTAYIKKVATDEPLTSEERTVSIIKVFFDSIGVTDDFFGPANPDDDQTMVFEKNVLTTNADTGLVDEQTSQVRKPSVEVAGLLERAVYEFSKLNEEQVGNLDAAVVAFLAERADFTVFDEQVRSSITKSVADTLGATDDFYGETNVDDDQTSHLFRPLSDTVPHPTDTTVLSSQKASVDVTQTQESQNFTVGKPVSEDYSVADPFAAHTTKPFYEALGVGDHLALSLAKFRADGLIAPDDPLVYYFPQEGIPSQNDLGKLEDQAAKSYWKSFQEYGSCATRVYALTYKPLSETCGLYNEAQTLSLGKDSTEAVGVQNSGFVVMTDYCNSSYFAEPYVGVGRAIT